MSYMQNNLAFAGGIQELSLDEIEFVSGGSVDAPPGSPLLGINPYVLDSLENYYYGRTYSNGLWFAYEGGGFYSAWNADGDRVAWYEETTSENATRTLTSSVSSTAGVVSAENTSVVNIRPINSGN